ncbi:hypothetical protein BJ170DRAFT_702897 [Xylariales sp. AK1849]|nr:hypothetical protein BJ170DRAFT_702897 [Xylariales sp. AK1849]
MVTGMEPAINPAATGSTRLGQADNNRDTTHLTTDTDAYIGDARFSQTFTLPPGPGRPEPFQVTYSDYGYRNPAEPEQENVLLFCGPLLCTRFLHIAKDELAKRHHVRIINPDRPGIGGTTAVDAHLRLNIWLEIVPALMQHLNVSHFTLACQSAGTLYALNTLLHLRHLLRPERPYVAFCGPWIHPTHSGVSLMSLSSALPSAVLKRFDSVASFLHSNIAPAMGFSSGLLSNLTPSWRQQKQTLAEGADAQMVEFEEKLMPRIIDRVYTEDIQGMSQEVLLLLKKSGAGPSGDNLVWGTWDDIDKFVPMLAALEEEKAANDSSHAKLEVNVFFAESDHMIGDKTGPRWLEDCWNSERRGGNVHFQSHVIQGTEHDSILDLRYGVAERIFQKMSGISDEND